MKKTLLIGSLLILGVTAAVAQVRTENGMVSGVPGAQHPEVTSYKGIPYAAPPIGDLRWRDPRPPAPWQDIRKADKLGPSCIQTPAKPAPPLTEEYYPQNDFSEDCLYLNVWSATTKSGDKRPVLVWLHGGGSSEGSSASAVYDGEALAGKGLVVVSVNFRIAQLGFFTHPDLAKESSRNTPGNYGFMDILTALRWVQKNIAAFGGDPSRVSIGGQGWGVACVQALTASPMFKGLFHRVILEGNAGFGAGNSGGARNMEDAQRDGLQYAQDRGGKSLAELRAMPIADLRKSTGRLIRFGPVVDGSILPDVPRKVVNEGKQIDVATLTGMDLDAGGGPNAGNISLEEWRKQVQDRYAEMAADFLKLYPSETEEQVSAAQKASARDQTLISIDLWAKTKTKLGKAPVFTYLFTHAQPGEFKERFGVFARSEEPYFFNNLGKISRPWDADDRKLADIMSNYLVNFVAAGDPNGKGLPGWPAFDAKIGQTMEIGDRIAPRAFADKAIIDFFERYLSRPAAAAADPDFSGTWIFDRIKSDVPKATGGKPPQVQNVTLIIKQSGNELAIATKREEGSDNAKYTLDGKENRNLGPKGRETVSKATLEGSNLVIETTMETDSGLATTRSVYSLSDDGKVLTVTNTRGENTFKQVFNRQ